MRNVSGASGNRGNGWRANGDLPGLAKPLIAPLAMGARAVAGGLEIAPAGFARAKRTEQEPGWWRLRLRGICN